MTTRLTTCDFCEQEMSKYNGAYISVMLPDEMSERFDACPICTRKILELRIRQPTTEPAT